MEIRVETYLDEDGVKNFGDFASTVERSRWPRTSISGTALTIAISRPKPGMTASIYCALTTFELTGN